MILDRHHQGAADEIVGPPSPIGRLRRLAARLLLGSLGLVGFVATVFLLSESPAFAGTTPTFACAKVGSAFTVTVSPAAAETSVAISLSTITSAANIDAVDSGGDSGETVITSLTNCSTYLPGASLTIAATRSTPRSATAPTAAFPRPSKATTPVP